MQYIIFDLEATCWAHRPAHVQSEIIEIGAVRVDEAGRPVDEFATFVRPSRSPVLSDFCTALTSITQAEVDHAPWFAEAMAAFENWIGEPGGTTLLSWGHYDRKQLLEECAAKRYNGRILDLLQHHRSLKHDCAAMRGERPCGMKGALAQLDLPLEGTHHRGIDDARNIARIFRAVLADWRVYTQQTVEQQ